MRKSTIALVCTSIIVISCAQLKKVNRQHRFKAIAPAIPVLRVTSDTTATAVKISSISIDIGIASNIATTSYTITFYNPNDRILEGEFEFPLADGQQVSGYALDIDGHLRAAVAVEKAKGRVAFENTIRRKIDPGLVEKTVGNNFRTRVYPLPAKGFRTIRIAVEQLLDQEQGDRLYQLPVFSKEKIDSFHLTVFILGEAGKPIQAKNNTPAILFNKEPHGYRGRFSTHHFSVDSSFAFVIPGGTTANILTDRFNEDDYFYASLPVMPQYRQKKSSASIAILWDISGSAIDRDIEKELSLLQRYLSTDGTKTVTLIPFNISVQKKESFSITNGNTGALMEKIRAFEYDGGTQFGAIDLGSTIADEVLLFSDGITNFGNNVFPKIAAPVSVITSSRLSNYSLLRHITQQSHGQLIDLTSKSIDIAVKQLQEEPLQMIGLRYDSSAINELAYRSAIVDNSGFSIAGKMKKNSSSMTLEFGFGNEVVHTEQFTVSSGGAEQASEATRAWALMKISQLEMQSVENKKAITAIGKQFSIVTSHTSLIVLDRVEDYVEHEITPPAELLAEYTVLFKEKKKSDNDKSSRAFDEAIEAMEALKDWWNNDYADTVSVKWSPSTIVDGAAQTDSISTIMSNRVAGLAISELSQDQEISEGTASGERDLKSSYFLSMNKSEVAPSITINPWSSDAPYLKTLARSTADKRYSTYLLLKKQYGEQPSFFMDVAFFFFNNNEKKLAIQVLSNAAEIKLENAELLRMMAQQLMEAGEKDLAISTYQQVLYLREEDPQSLRDLALAYNEKGYYQKAISSLYSMILGTWDPRFGDVKAIGLNEMNAIISAHKNEVDISSIDPRLVYAMPVDVRIVVGWNTDNSDVDLWVTDPRLEKCFYSHPQTTVGGKISRDVTQGYGPEEFLLRKAMNGEYVVEVNLYGDSRQTMGGPIVIHAELFTDFGKPTQQRKTINFRVTDQKEVVRIGALGFKG